MSEPTDAQVPPPDAATDADQREKAPRTRSGLLTRIAIVTHNR
jgi:hypothetical protein